MDCLVWSGEKTGAYSVRSGYNLLRPSCAIPTLDAELFKSIWNVKCPPKVRIQVWRSLCNFFPTKACLYYRRIAQNPTCPVCLNEPESREHVFRDCVNASMIWQGMGYNWPSTVLTLSFKEWLSWLLVSHPMVRHSEILITLWSIWYVRNKKLHEGVNNSYNHTIMFIKAYCREVESLLPRQFSPPSSVVIRWNAPLVGVVKANFDACFRTSENFAWS
ncbi:hypothetical protein like AT3G09510 [Hibiscus trionum]|uniref:Reverse transcriptase zinc-binding domain-containing protein n=1 Tax=Hibiscus trionum TaxID=183268 RepID=A0A9W7HP47_HIBTR|nr:hypothetical protein like AT3G09510 [Hibiscus trionum]